MRINNSRQGFLDWLVEHVAIKSGLLLQVHDLTAILESSYAAPTETIFHEDDTDFWWIGHREDGISLRAEALETDFLTAMHAIGAIPDLSPPDYLVLQFIKLHAVRMGIDRDDIMSISSETGDLMLSISSVDPDSTSIPERFSSLEGLEDLIVEFRRRYILYNAAPERRDWDGNIHLRDLFESEDIPEGCTPNQYFDQRFIDFLCAQPDELDQIHWRQFEYLAAEFFRRNGYEVKVGPGRKDGGVDVIAVKRGKIIGPDSILIQCKRQRSDTPVGLEVVKAFWATLNDEGATRGLIATTSRLTGGARSYCDARKYRLSSVEGEHVSSWINDLSTHTRG